MKVVADAFSVFIRGIMRDSASLSNTVERPPLSPRSLLLAEQMHSARLARSLFALWR